MANEKMSALARVQANVGELASASQAATRLFRSHDKAEGTVEEKVEAAIVAMFPVPVPAFGLNADGKDARITGKDCPEDYRQVWQAWFSHLIDSDGKVKAGAEKLHGSAKTHFGKVKARIRGEIPHFRFNAERSARLDNVKREGGSKAEGEAPEGKIDLLDWVSKRINEIIAKIQKTELNDKRCVDILPDLRRCVAYVNSAKPAAVLPATNSTKATKAPTEE